MKRYLFATLATGLLLSACSTDAPVTVGDGSSATSATTSATTDGDNSGGNEPAQGQGTATATTSGKEQTGELPAAEYDNEPAALKELNQSGKEFDARVVECLNDRGWKAALGSSGFSVEVAEEDDDKYKQDEAACNESSGVNDMMALSRSEETARAIYDVNLKAKSCLEARGIDISEPPSVEEFIKQYQGPEDTSQPRNPYWMPHREIPRPEAAGMDEKTYKELFAACPPPA